MAYRLRLIAEIRYGQFPEYMKTWKKLDSVMRKQGCTIGGKIWQCWPAAVRNLEILLDQGPVKLLTVAFHCEELASFPLMALHAAVEKLCAV